MYQLLHRTVLMMVVVVLSPYLVMASSIIPPKDYGELVRLSDLVVIAKAGDGEGFRRGEIVMTGTRFEVIQVLKGSLATGQSFTVETIGGIAGEFGLHISGSPQFTSGKTYLLSLTLFNGAWVPRVMSYGLLVEHTLPSGEKAFTHMAEVHDLNVVIPDGVHVETVGMYKANNLITHVKQLVEGTTSWNKDRAGYLSDMVHEHVEAPVQMNGLPGPIVQLSTPPTGCEYMAYTGTKIRWNRFATDQSVNVNLTSGAPALAVTAAQSAVNGWKALSGIDVSSLTYNGAAASAATCSSGEIDLNNSGISLYNANIFLDDPCGEIADLTSCAGTLAVAGPAFNTGNTHTFNSETWITALIGYMIINNGTPGCLSTTQYNQVVTHELGHIIGFGHHTGGTANMNATCCNPITTLDQTCAVYIYGDGTSSNPVPTITSISPTSAPQGSTGVNVAINGTNFMAGGSVSVSGSGITITAASLISSSRITMTLNINADAATGVRNITVTNPAPGGGTSNAGSFTVTAAASAPTVTTAAVTNISTTSAAAGGNVTSQGSSTVTARGVCYATTTNPTTSNSCVSSGSGTGSFTASLTGLSASTTYYVRAYATNSVGTSYGANVSFTTSSTSNPIPTITAVTPASAPQGSTGLTVSVDGTNFMVGGSIVMSGDGVSITSAFLISATKITMTLNISASATTGVRNITVTNPAPGGGVSNNGSFTITTPASTPTVTTAAISSITGSTATAGGNVTSEGSASVSARGVCYATTQNPTTSNTCVSSGSGAGSFTASLTGLSPSTTYYVRAYATNTVGTAYGANVSFTTTAQARPILKPLSSSTSVTINQPFRIDVEIGSGAEVQNLYGIAFKLRSQATYVSYIDATAARGTFLGSGILEFFRKANEQTVEVSLTKTAAPGVSGKGVVASANFISTQTGNVTFELIDVTALDPAGQPIALTTENLNVSVTAGASMCVYPGDTNNDSAIDGSDLIPIGLFYGQTLGNSNTPGVSMQCQLRSPWPADSGTPRRIYADANGDGTINASDVLAIGLNYGKARPSAPPAKIVASSATVQPEPTTMELKMEHRWLGSQRLRLDLYSSSTRALQGLAATIQLDPSLMERVSAYRVVSTGSPLGDRTLSFVQPIVQSEAGGQGYELSVVSTEAVTSVQGGPVMSLELDLKQGIPRSVPVNLTRLEWVEADQSWYQLARLPQPYILTPPQGSKDAADQAQEDVLESNYPNPFNPVTQLRYRLGEDTRVRLEVYTMTGTLVKVLVDRYQTKGSYTVDFDGSELSSGVYLYRLQTPSYIKTNKMVLIK